MARSERGSALLEALPVFSLLIAFTGGLFAASYVLFARAWMEFQSEQALYCLAESKGELTCRHQLETQVQMFLPWGEVRSGLHAGPEEWTVDLQWRFDEHQLRLRKHLTPQLIMGKKALPWSL